MRLTEKAFKEFKVIWKEEYPEDTKSEEELRDIATRVMRAHEVVYSWRRTPFEWAEYCLEKDWIYDRHRIERIVFPTLEEMHKHVSRYICDGKQRFWDYSKSNPLFWVRKPY